MKYEVRAVFVDGETVHSCSLAIYSTQWQQDGHPPASHFAVYENMPDGTQQVVADFYGQLGRALAETFVALMENEDD